MKKWLRAFGVPFLIGAIFIGRVALLESDFKFTFPQAAILVTVPFAWWAIAQL